jgi:hypothetical protein
MSYDSNVIIGQGLTMKSIRSRPSRTRQLQWQLKIGNIANVATKTRRSSMNKQFSQAYYRPQTLAMAAAEIEKEVSPILWLS